MDRANRAAVPELRAVPALTDWGRAVLPAFQAVDLVLRLMQIRVLAAAVEIARAAPLAVMAAPVASQSFGWSNHGNRSSRMDSKRHHRQCRRL